MSKSIANSIRIMIKKEVFKLSKEDQLLVDKILSFEHNIHMPKNISTSLNYTIDHIENCKLDQAMLQIEELIDKLNPKK